MYFVLMKIFNYKSYGFKKIFSIFGIKITISNKKKYRNKFVPLGFNCYARQAFTFNGIKPRKKYGELSYPFDLIPIDEKKLDEVLKNDFEGFCDNLKYDEKSFCKWTNGYNIIFPHDYMSNEDEFKKRYINRINNFRNIISKHKDCIIYSVKFFDHVVDANDLNSIYESLLKISKGNSFKYFFFHFVTNKQDENIRNINEINSNIIYHEVEVNENFSKDWTNKNNYFDTEYCRQIYEKIQEKVNI